MPQKNRMRAATVAARWWRRDRSLCLALAALALLQLILRGVMHCPAAAQFAVRYLVRPYHRAMGWLCSFLPFSAAELCWAVLIVFCLWYVVRTVWLLIHPPEEKPAGKGSGDAAQSGSVLQGEKTASDKSTLQNGNRPTGGSILRGETPYSGNTPPGENTLQSKDIQQDAGSPQNGARRLSRGAVLWRRILGGVLTALAVYTGYTVLWGLVYYGPTFERQAGIEARPVSVDELEYTMRWFRDRINETAPLVEHAAPGVLTGDTSAIFRASGPLYDALEEAYPFLGSSAVRPKQMMFSRVMSWLNFTGFFFPFTGEANLNVDSPECLLPATIAHELAHVRGIAPEQTANFVAILACDTCGDALYAYSGYLLGYIHLSNALYGASYNRWLEVAQGLCETANEDLRANNDYWRQFDTPVSEAADSAYSGFLQSYDQELGSKSYGAVVDQLVAYYGPSAA